MEDAKIDEIEREITRFSLTEKVVTMWSPSDRNVVVKTWILNSLSILKHVLSVLDDTGTLQ